MSENNKPELITTEAELLPAEPFDFEFIAHTLGLFPYQALGPDDQTSYHGALNPGAIINLEVTDEGYLAITLHGGEEIVMDRVHASQFEKTLKHKVEEARAQAKAAMLQAGIQHPGTIVGVPTGKRFRQ